MTSPDDYESNGVINETKFLIVKEDFRLYAYCSITGKGNHPL